MSTADTWWAAQGCCEPSYSVQNPQQTLSGPQMSIVLKLNKTRKKDGRVGPEQKARGSGVNEQGGAGSRSPSGRASSAPSSGLIPSVIGRFTRDLF